LFWISSIACLLAIQCEWVSEWMNDLVIILKSCNCLTPTTCSR
jgi:hypothetical protein